MIESVAYEVFKEVFKEDIIKEGKLETARDMVIEALEERFDIISARLVEKINKVEDVVVLKGLLRQAMRCKSLEEFDKILEKAM